MKGGNETHDSKGEQRGLWRNRLKTVPPKSHNNNAKTPKQKESLSCLCIVEDLRWLGSEIWDPRGKNHKPTPTNLNSSTYNNHHQAPSKPRKTINPPSSLSLSISSIYGFISLFFFSSLTARFELLISRSAPSFSRSMPPFFSFVADKWVCRWVMIFFFFSSNCVMDCGFVIFSPSSVWFFLGLWFFFFLALFVGVCDRREKNQIES